jgi:putative membrane protein
MRAILTWLITAAAVAVAIWLVPGVEMLGSNTILSILVLAVILAFLNAFIKPVLKVISFPITVITLGIFALVVNTGLLYLAAWMGNNLFDTGLYLASFWSALLASIIISIVTAILNGITGAKDPRSQSRAQ